MKNRKLFILAMITLVVIIAAGITAKMRAPQTRVEKELLFPALAEQINAVNAVTIQSHKNTVTLKQHNGQWVLESADNYPALFNKIRATVLSLSELRIAEEKTSNPELYKRLAVEGPEHEGRSLLITVKDKADQTLASLIVGDPRQSSGSKPGMYVRRPDGQQALLAEGSLQISANQVDWFERSLFNIPPEAVQSVKISYPDGKEIEIYKDTKEEPDFKTRGMNIENESAAKIILKRMSTGLEEMSVDGVLSAQNFTFPENTIITTVQSFDGLQVTVKLAKVEDKAYAYFTFAANPLSPEEQLPDTETSADTESTDTAAPAGATTAENQQPSPEEIVRMTNEAVGAWVYQIPDFKYEAMTKNPEDLKNPFQTISEQ